VALEAGVLLVIGGLIARKIVRNFDLRPPAITRGTPGREHVDHPPEGWLCDFESCACGRSDCPHVSAVTVLHAKSAA